MKDLYLKYKFTDRGGRLVYDIYHMPDNMSLKWDGRWFPCKTLAAVFPWLILTACLDCSVSILHD